MRELRRCLGMGLMMLAGLAGAADYPFEVSGIGGAGGMFTPAVSPRDPRLIFVSCDMGGDYRSTDGGRHWTMLHSHQMSDSRACRPLFVGDDIIWMSGALPKISHDNGATWHPLVPFSTLPWKGQVIRMAAAPGDPNVLLFGTDVGELWRSADAGKTWTLSRKGRVYSILGLGRKIYASVGTAFLTSRDNGATWEEIDVAASVPETKGHPFLSLAGGSAGGATVLYGPVFQLGMLQSLDEGRTWKKVDQFRDCNEVLMAGNQTGVAYAVQSGYSGATHWFRTRDGGATWEDCFRMHGAQANVELSWVQTQLKWGCTVSSLGAAVSATDAKMALLTTQGDFYITRDGGDSWQPVMNEEVAARRFRSTGLEVTSCWHYLVDPFDKNRRYIAYTDIGFARSMDKGETWMHSVEGCPWGNTFYEVLFDPAVSGRMYAATSTRHDIPNWTATAALKPGQVGGICISQDAGATWKPMTNGLPRLPCTSIALDQRPVSDPRALRTIYATFYEGGCYKSVDGGKTWMNKSTGLGNPGNLHAYKVFVHPKTGAIYCSITAFRQNPNNYPVPGGLWKSSNGGDTWVDLTQALKLHWPAGFAVHPDNPDIIYVAAATIKGGREGGVYATQDGGKTWVRQLRDEDFAATGGPSYVQAFYVNLDPLHPDHVYLGTCGHGLWVSIDAGKAWKPLSGFPFASPTNVSFDPDHADLMHVCTFGGGVWRGPRLP